MLATYNIKLAQFSRNKRRSELCFFVFVFFNAVNRAFSLQSKQSFLLLSVLSDVNDYNVSLEILLIAVDSFDLADS